MASKGEPTARKRAAVGRDSVLQSKNMPDGSTMKPDAPLIFIGSAVFITLKYVYRCGCGIGPRWIY
jgi:hypothetical protein